MVAEKATGRPPTKIGWITADIGEVRPAEIRVVHAIDVAFAHRRKRIDLQHFLDDGDESREVDRDGDRLREGLAADREQAR